MTVSNFHFEIFSSVIFLVDSYYICYSINCSLFYLENIFASETHILCLDNKGALLLNLENISREYCMIIFSPNLLAYVDKLLSIRNKIDSKLVDIAIQYNIFLDYAAHNFLCKKIKSLKQEGIFYKCNCTEDKQNIQLNSIKLPFQYKYFKLSKRAIKKAIFKNCNILFFEFSEFKNIFCAFYYYKLEWPLLIICEDEKQRKEVIQIVERYSMYFFSLKFFKENTDYAHKKINFKKCNNALRAVNRELKREFEHDSEETEELELNTKIRDFQLNDIEPKHDSNLMIFEEQLENFLSKIHIKTFKEMRGGDEQAYDCVISLLKITNTKSMKYKMINKLIKTAAHFALYCYYPIGSIDYYLLKGIFLNMQLLTKVSTDRSIYYDNRRATVYNRCTQNVYYKLLSKVGQIKYQDMINYNSLKKKINFLCKNVMSIYDE